MITFQHIQIIFVSSYRMLAKSAADCRAVDWKVKDYIFLLYFYFYFSNERCPGQWNGASFIDNTPLCPLYLLLFSTYLHV